MKGVFVNWTKPYVERKRLRGQVFSVYRSRESDQYITTDQELLFTILSVGYWKKLNGPTKLFTDITGFDYYRKNNLLKLWDEIDVHTLENYDYVDAGQFWTAGKTFAICKQEPPFVFLDLDFIVRHKLPDWVFESKVTIPHWEIPRGHVYPTEQQYSEIKHWKPKDGYSYKMLIPNTSFLYINEPNVQKEYLEEHAKAVNTKDEVPEWFWLITDQGLFGQSLRNNDVMPQTLTDRVFLSDTEYFTSEIGRAVPFFYSLEHDKSKDEIDWEHVWFRKIVYSYDDNERVKDCRRFYKEIIDNLPEFAYMVDNPRLSQYK
jgi:hypothetical protein